MALHPIASRNPSRKLALKALKKSLGRGKQTCVCEKWDLRGQIKRPLPNKKAPDAARPGSLSLADKIRRKVIPGKGASIGNEKRARTFFAQTKFFEDPQGSGASRQKSRDVPESSKPKEDKPSRAGAKFSATTPSSGRPQPHRAVSGPQKLIFVLFFLA